MSEGGISQTSRKVARNTVLLYFRMLVLMIIGLFTSRLVLQSLGVDDYGTYNVVYSVVMMFTVLSNGISGSISRFLAFEIGKGDRQRLKKVFSNAVLIQLALIVLLVLLAESLGLWYFRTQLSLPSGREGAAMWAFQASVALLAVQLLSIPFNCAIIAHEDMKAFAWISLLEGTLKLCVAFCLFAGSCDKLKLYAALMVAVALLTRTAYALYCHRHYDETKGKLVYDRGLMKEMVSLGAWSFTAHGVGVFNTQGVNLLTNSAFGVAVNAARGIAGQIENIVRQFISNFLTALNPLLTKTWAKGDRAYSYALARKGCKFSCLIGLLCAIPFVFESDFILGLWLVEVPQSAAVFTTLAIVCVTCDMASNSLSQLLIANGKVALYYIVTSCISALTFFGTFLAFRCGLPAFSAYCITATVFLLIAGARLVFVHSLCGFPYKEFFLEVLLPLLLTAALSLAISWLPHHFLDGVLGSLLTIATSLLSLVAFASLFCLTKGERDYFKTTLKSKLHKA